MNLIKAKLSPIAFAILCASCASNSRFPASVEHGTAAQAEAQAAPQMTLEQYAQKTLDTFRTLEKVRKQLAIDYQGKKDGAKAAIEREVAAHPATDNSTATYNAMAALVLKKHPKMAGEVNKMRAFLDSNVEQPVASFDDQTTADLVREADALNPKTLAEAVAMHKINMDERIEGLKQLPKPLPPQLEMKLMKEWLSPRFTEEIFDEAARNQGVMRKDHQGELDEMYRDRNRYLHALSKVLGMGEVGSNKGEKPSASP